MTKGWFDQPQRHALASKGIQTANSLSQSKINQSREEIQHLSDCGRKQIKALIEKSDGNEWIADLDLHNGEIMIYDEQISDKPDESVMNWDEHITQQQPHTDPEFNVGYIHYHPPVVDERPTAQDFILGLSVDKRRLDENKKRFEPTVFGLVTDDEIKFYYLTPKSEKQREEYIDKLKEIQDENLSDSEYFGGLKEIKEEMKNDGILYKNKIKNWDGNEK